MVVSYLSKVKGRKNFEILNQLNEALEIQRLFISRKSFNIKTATTNEENTRSRSTTEHNSLAVIASNTTDQAQNSNCSFLNSKQPSLLPSLSFLDSSFFMRPESFISNANNNKRKAETDSKPKSLEAFLESIDMSAYYNLINAKGISDLESLLKSNKRVFFKSEYEII
jgi:hypothetical protein